jgi:hypothetical protein
MSAQIIPFDPHDFLWKRIIHRDIDAFLSGKEREMCAANVGRALRLGLGHEIQAIKDCWAEAQRIKSAAARESA